MSKPASREAPRGGQVTVLGLSAFAHDPAACLFVDGRLVAAIEQERLDRCKRSTAFPHEAIAKVLDLGGLRLEQIDVIAYYWNDWGQLPRSIGRACAQAWRNPRGMALVTAQRAGSLGTLRRLLEALATHCDGDPSRVPPLRCIDHHLAHAVAAVASAPFDADAVLVIDGRGEHASTSLYGLTAKKGREKRLHLLEDYAFPNSLGVFYGAITQCLGYRALADEYKVMGLAAYGDRDPELERRVARLLAVHEDGSYQVNLRKLEPHRCSDGSRPWLTVAASRELTGPLTNGDEGAANLAHAGQRQLEAALLGLVRRLTSLSSGRRLVVTGGVAMNAAAIGRLRQSADLDRLHVPLAPTDAGSSVGAALAVLDELGEALPPSDTLVDPFLGPRYTDRQIESALLRTGRRFKYCADAAVEAAVEIAEGQVVGWFDGRMEFGERALGARSILGDPRDPRTRERINDSVKRREPFRPFAPSILEEHADTWFEVDRSRCMGEIVRARQPAHERAPAIVHVDGTARPQTVPTDWPALAFRRLIEQYHALTGVPMVVNTSFNAATEPIVCSPEDALRSFASSRLDALYLGPYRVERESL